MKYILIDELPDVIKQFGGTVLDNPCKYYEEKGYNTYRQEALSKARELTEEDIRDLFADVLKTDVKFDLQYQAPIVLAKAILQKLEGGEDVRT